MRHNLTLLPPLHAPAHPVPALPVHYRVVILDDGFGQPMTWIETDDVDDALDALVTAGIAFGADATRFDVLDGAPGDWIVGAR